MTESVGWKPPQYSSVTPYLIVKGAAEAIAFYEKVFGAEEIQRLEMPDGRLGHAEIRIGDSRIMLADEFPEMDIRSPSSLEGTSVSLLLYVEDAAAVFHASLDAGARMFKPLAEQFYGDLSGTIEDPYGHRWTIASHIEDVSPEEIKARMDAMSEGEDC